MPDPNEKARKEGEADYQRKVAEETAGVKLDNQGDIEKAAKAQAKRVPANIETNFIDQFLELDIKTFVERLTNDKVLGHFSFVQAQGLLALERAGKNRTPYVEALCKRLDVKSPYEVTDSGPAWTNDVSNVSLIEADAK